MIKAILFDMDGTVLNTLEDIKISVNYALSQFGLPLKSDMDIKLAVGNGAYTLIESVVPDSFPKDRIKDVFDIYQKYYEIHSRDHTAPYLGVLDLLKNLKQINFKIGVVSNKFEYLVKELNETLFYGLFDVSIGEVDGIPIKPAPDMIYKALHELNIKKEEAIYLGDTSTDMKTAKNAGLKSVGVLWGFRDEKELLEHGADYIISHPNDLISIIDEVNL